MTDKEVIDDVKGFQNEELYKIVEVKKYVHYDMLGVLQQQI